jgi:chromosome segregation ATPase
MRLRDRQTFGVLLLTVLLLLPTLIFAQSSQNGTSTVDKNKVISRLLLEIDADREVIATSQARSTALETELAEANTENKELTEAHKTALLELGELRATIKYKQAAIDERNQQVTELRSERDESRKENKHLRKENLILKLVLVGITILRYTH